MSSEKALLKELWTISNVEIPLCSPGDLKEDCQCYNCLTEQQAVLKEEKDAK